MEGGAYGHMSHPFDDMDLTFGDLKDIISKALNGELGVVREKTDGQALAISWKNGRLIAARNKGNLANAGANAVKQGEGRFYSKQRQWTRWTLSATEGRQRRRRGDEEKHGDPEVCLRDTCGKLPLSLSVPREQAQQRDLLHSLSLL